MKHQISWTYERHVEAVTLYRQKSGKAESALAGTDKSHSGASILILKVGRMDTDTETSPRKVQLMQDEAQGFQGEIINVAETSKILFNPLPLQQRVNRIIEHRACDLRRALARMRFPWLRLRKIPAKALSQPTVPFPP